MVKISLIQASTFSAIKRHISSISSKYYKKMSFAFTLMLLSSALEAIGLVGVYYFIRTVDSIETARDTPVLSRIVDLFGVTDNISIIILLGMLLLTLYFIKSLVMLSTNYFWLKIVARIQVSSAIDMLSGYMNENYANHITNDSSEIVRNTHILPEQVNGSVLNSYLTVIFETFVVCSVVITLSITNIYVSSAVLLYLAIVVLLFKHFYIPKVYEYGRIRKTTNAKSISTINQILLLIKEIKVLSKEQYFIDKFSNIAKQKAEASKGFNFIKIIPNISLEILLLFGVVLVITIMSKSVPEAELFAVVGMFSVGLLRIMTSVVRIVNGVNAFTFAKAAVEELTSEHERLLVNREVDIDAYHGNRANKFEKINSIALHNISYKYHGADRYSLRNLSITVEAGESLGILGPSGAGKSTLTMLLIGLLNPVEGEIIVNGNNIDGMLVTLRNRIGYVSQSVSLVAGTLKDNIAFGVDPDDIDHDMFKKVIRIARLDALLERLPDGADTFLGENGMMLSGGERQRVSIARMLYVSPDIIIFDEATSSLDTNTEDEISDMMYQLFSDKILIVIAHRISTLMKCSKLAFVKDGVLAGVGEYNQLVKTIDGFSSFVKSDSFK